MSRFLERRTVSRKTPKDGKLEISADAARALASVGTRLSVEWAGRSAPVTVVTMRCTCKGRPGEHEHFFVQSDVFRVIEPESNVDLAIDEGSGRLAVTPVP